MWNACGFYIKGANCYEEPSDNDPVWHMISTLEERELAVEATSRLSFSA